MWILAIIKENHRSEESLAVELINFMTIRDFNTKSFCALYTSKDSWFSSEMKHAEEELGNCHKNPFSSIQITIEKTPAGHRCTNL